MFGADPERCSVIATIGGGEIRTTRGADFIGAAFDAVTFARLVGNGLCLRFFFFGHHRKRASSRWSP